MKKEYLQPRMDVVVVKTGAQLLVASIVGAPVYDENANENEYGL